MNTLIVFIILFIVWFTISDLITLVFSLHRIFDTSVMCDRQSMNGIPHPSFLQPNIQTHVLCARPIMNGFRANSGDQVHINPRLRRCQIFKTLKQKFSIHWLPIFILPLGYHHVCSVSGAAKGYSSGYRCVRSIKDSFVSLKSEFSDFQKN